MTISLAGSVLSLAAAGFPEITQSGRTLETGRHLITVGENGLPEQVFIKPVEAELPLEHRGRAVDDNSLLAGIGRGNMLRGPITLIASMDGNPVPATVTQAARPARRDDGSVAMTATVSMGDTEAALALTIDRTGALSGTITYRGGRVDTLDLVVPLADQVDTVIANHPASTQVQAHPAALGTLARGSGVVWANAQADADRLELPAQPGIPEALYVGTGDRGFTWLSQDATGWIADPVHSTMLIERDANGLLTWRIRLVNRAGAIPGSQTVTFALLTHPAGSRPANHRNRSWLDRDRPAAQGPGAVTYSAWRAASAAPALRADAAVTLEAFTDYAVLEGPAGGDAVSVAQNHVHTYPIALMRYLAGGATGNIVSLRSNASALTTSGANPATDRVLLGRALLFDIGLDATSVAHLASAANTLAALQRFGFFATDGQTEYIPFWRSHRLVRFGQEWDPDSAFDAVDDPNAQVHISVYRRPAGPDGHRKSLFVVVNESDAPVRDTLYVLDPAYAFGGLNVQTSFDIYGNLDFTGIPENSDWDPRAVKWISHSTVTTRGEGIGSMATFAMGDTLQTGQQGGMLEDIETHGIVKTFAVRDGIESYGPTLFIPAHGFRLLVGFGARD